MKREKATLWEIWNKGHSDPKYARMLVRLRAMEPGYEAVLKEISAQQQYTIQDYLMLCEDMSWRMLEIACMELEREKS